MNNSTDVIPEGIYCHGMREDKHYRCPYWSIDHTRPPQENGYCKFLGIGDWDSDVCTGLLWDRVKECGINDNWDDEDE
jgi:hypothetical protein